MEKPVTCRCMQKPIITPADNEKCEGGWIALCPNKRCEESKWANIAATKKDVIKLWNARVE